MKAHLATIRKGWQNEHLAQFILSKFAFLAHPSTIADDIGSDFFCTLFETISENGRDYLIPKNSFAIQIKSNTDNFSISNKLEYLQGLEIPFFVGVTNQNPLGITLYSGEYLLPFFVEVNDPKKVRVKLCERNTSDDVFWKTKSGNYHIRFPRVTTINSDITKMELKKQVCLLSNICTLMSKNIVRKNNEEYIFSEYESTRLLIPFDKGFVTQSLDKRFSKILFELAWLLENKSDIFDSESLQTYQDLLESLTRIALLDKEVGTD